MSSVSKTFIVLCATGNQGQAVVKTLSSHASSNNLEYKILAASRDPTSQKSTTLGLLRGVTSVKATAEDPDSIAAVIKAHGPVDGAFLVSPPFLPDEVEQCIEATDIFRELGVKHLVYSGVDLCGKPTLPLENFEKKRPIIEYIRSLDSSGFRTTLIGPVMFMDNFIAVSKAGHPRQFVASFDVGRVGAICLTDMNKYGGLDINLAGDELTPEEIAAAFKEVKDISLPTDEKPALPPFLQVSFKWFDENSFSANVKQCREMFPGMTDFRTFLTTQYP